MRHRHLDTLSRKKLDAQECVLVPSDDVAAWIEDHVARQIAEQRAVVDGAKVVATFAGGIAATLLATALQVGPKPSYLDLAAAGLWAVVLVLTIAVFLADDSAVDVDYAAIVGAGGSKKHQLRQLRQNLITAANSNSGLVTRAFRRVAWQGLFSVLVIASSVVSLVWTKCPTLDW